MFIVTGSKKNQAPSGRYVKIPLLTELVEQLPTSYFLLLNQFAEFAGGAKMDAGGFARHLAGAEEAVNPTQVLADLAFADDRVIDDAAARFGDDVIDEAVGAQVDADFPQSLIDLRAIGFELGAFNRRLDRPHRLLSLVWHSLVLSKTMARCN